MRTIREPRPDLTLNHGDQLTLEYSVAQLRHLYEHLIAAKGRNVDLEEMAEGLLAPQIRRFETLLKLG